MQTNPGLMGRGLRLGLVLVAGLLLAAGTVVHALPMTNDLELVAALNGAMDPAAAQPAPAQPSHISRIAARGEPVAHEDQPELFNTIVQELQAAGVYNAERRDLHTLSYKEVTRLLALWHLASGRNYYEASPGPDPVIAG